MNSSGLFNFIRNENEFMKNSELKLVAKKMIGREKLFYL
jgi:hypothetical protein